MTCSQLRKLLEMPGNQDRFANLREIIQQFRDDEMEHHDTGILHDAEKVWAETFHERHRKEGWKEEETESK